MSRLPVKGTVVTINPVDHSTHRRIQLVSHHSIPTMTGVVGDAANVKSDLLEVRPSFADDMVVTPNCLEDSRSNDARARRWACLESSCRKLLHNPTRAYTGNVQHECSSVLMRAGVFSVPQLTLTIHCSYERQWRIRLCYVVRERCLLFVRYYLSSFSLDTIKHKQGWGVRSRIRARALLACSFPAPRSATSQTFELTFHTVRWRR